MPLATKTRGFLAEDAGCFGFEGVDARVFAEDVVADLGASCIASRIARVGWVIVSLRKSRRSAASMSLAARTGRVTAMAVPASVTLLAEPGTIERGVT